MSLVKRNKIWHYDFVFKGQRIQGSTHQSNINKAKLVEAKVRSDLAMQTFGIGPAKTSPPFKDFIEGQFLESVSLNAKARRTAMFYREKSKRLLDYPPFVQSRLNQIDGEMIDRYKTLRAKSVKVTTINGELRCLRKALKMAEDWRLIPKCPKVRLLPNERRRDFVVSGELENAYLAAADYPLRQAAILMLDLGLRPEECVRLKKVDVSRATLTVREGKSVNAPRALPLTQRASDAIELLCALWPESEFLFPGRKGRHLRRGSLDNLHAKLRDKLLAIAEPAPGHVPVLAMPADAKDFVLYSFRHTFATRLAESGAQPFEIQKAMGHADIRMSGKYVHLSDAHIALAMKRKEMLDRIMRGEVHSDSGSEQKVPH